uniref:Uncharacterized protein n=1 Tax=Cacopsylla melanoneura TaxID=428564 RepID=A0A8D8QX29_9HEMI
MDNLPLLGPLLLSIFLCIILFKREYLESFLMMWLRYCSFWTLMMFMRYVVFFIFMQCSSVIIIIIILERQVTYFVFLTQPRQQWILKSLLNRQDLTYYLLYCLILQCCHNVSKWNLVEGLHRTIMDIMYVCKTLPL